ncbi:MAG: septum formation protein Maf [Desulfobulbaceae bacterium]|nr:septum formation protein Maf [Desulfobulbaceae bacterium]
MYCNNESIVLASGSPRRQQYLKDLGISFTVCSASIDETPVKGEGADLFAVRMAREKAEAVSNQFYRSWIIAGDTVVCLGSKILGKPLDNEDAFSMLMSLSGKEHIVRTGIFLCNGEKKIYDQRIVATKVVFADFDESTAWGYVHTGECLDKAGAYGIQGKGAALVKAINGSYSNVVGLPLYELLEMLRYYRIVEPRC